MRAPHPRSLRSIAALASARAPALARAAGLAAIVLAVAACPAPRAARGPVGKSFTGCLPLPGTSRTGLRLGPDRHHLYWTEQVRLHGYEDSWPTTAIVRWSLDGGAVEHLTNLMENPYRVLADGRLVGVRKDAGITVWSPFGAELVSLSGSIDHLELLASEQAVVYREGQSIYRQPMHRQAARWLGYADALLGVDGDAVIIRNANDSGDHLLRVEAATGKATDLPWQDDVAKAVPGALIIQNDLGIGVRPSAGGPVKTVLTGDGWQVRVGPDGVKAWRKIGPRLDGAIVTASGADAMPPVLGGDSLEGFVRLPDGRVAYLVGHDLDDDGEVTTGDEVDVCLAAGDSQEVRIEPRSAPGRWRAAGDAVAALVKDRLGGGTWHFAAGDAVPGLYLEVGATRGERPGADLAAAQEKSRQAIRADLRAVAAAVAKASGDDTLFIDITYADGKRGFGEWWAGTGRRVGWAGTGGATVPALADYDALIATEELADLPVLDADEGEGDEAVAMARCMGTVTNTGDHTLVDLVADCVSGVDDDPIDVTPATLAPGQTGRFEGVVKRVGGANLAVSVHSGNGRDELPGFAKDRYDRYVALDQTAAEIADRTDLIYKEASADGGEVTVHVAALPAKDFARWSGQAQEQAAATALEVLERLSPVPLGGNDGDSIRLRITSGSRTWWFSDGHLTSDED